MRDFHPDLIAALATGCTTLCRCVRLARADGAVLGFTDHDSPIDHDGIAYVPSDGFEASQESSALGPSVGEWDFRAALSDDRLTQEDLLAGHYDGATVEMFLVDWRNAAVFQKLSSGIIGEVTSRDGAFQAEVRGPFSAYDRKRGRVFSSLCNAELGDTRCAVDVGAPAYTLQGEIADLPVANVVHVAGGGAFAAQHFTGGLFRRGSDAAIRVRAHRQNGSNAELELWQTPVVPLAVGQNVTITAGCDKRYETCRAKFSKGSNFRGFPYMPGDDFALSYPSSADGTLNGASLHK